MSTGGGYISAPLRLTVSVSVIKIREPVTGLGPVILNPPKTLSKTRRSHGTSENPNLIDVGATLTLPSMVVGYSYFILTLLHLLETT